MAWYIDAEHLKKVIDVFDYKYGLIPISALTAIIDSVKTADVAPVVHGHWMTGTTKWGLLPYQCSACKEFEEGSTKYCPDCGAKMDEEVKQDV